MPLLGHKVFHLKSPPTPRNSDESVYVVKHTNERFTSKEDYQKRLTLYKSPVWTCQCTGQLNLTHEEAWLSEQNARESLREGFPNHHEQPTLEMVHHSTDKLDQIVDKCWQLFHETFIINEPITLKVKANGRQFNGKVVRIDKSGALPNGNCSSPSSDKENKSGVSETDSPRKWKPKLLPYSYSMKLATEEKIVNGIPAADIERVVRPPSKELLRLFIRTRAVRYGQASSSPWVVDEKFVKKYGLKDKCPDLNLHKERQIEAIDKAVDEILRKRKADVSLQSPPSKKQKLADHGKKKDKKDKSDRKSPHKQSTLNFMKSPKQDGESVKKSPMKSPKKSTKASDHVQVLSDSSDEESLAKKRTKVKDDGDSISVSDSSDEDQPLADIAKKAPEQKRGRKQQLKTKANMLLNRKGVVEEKKKKKKKKVDDDKKMKQLTIFGSGAKKIEGLTSPKSTPKNSPAKTGPKSPPRTPRICNKIQKAMKAGDQALVKKLTLQAAKDLSARQVRNMPEGDLKASIEAKIQFLEERQRFKNMTPEQRLAYKKRKVAEMKKKVRLRNQQSKKRFEDQEIEGSSLPMPKLVPTPEGLPNECFGDIAVVTEFLSCYKDLLMPESKQGPFEGSKLMKALTSGPAGFQYMSQVLVVILQTLLQDQIAEDYREFRLPLSEIPVNVYTASEMVRLCLRRHDHDRPDDRDDDDDDLHDQDDVPDELIDQLDGAEFYELEPQQKLRLLISLCSRVLSTYSVQDFMEERQKDLAKVWKQRINCLKEKNDDLKKKKEEKKSANQDANNDSAKQDGGGDGPMMDFLKKGSPEKELDLATKVKRRREMAAKSAAERLEREKEQKRIRQQELEEQRKLMKRQQMEVKFEEVSSRARVVTRQCPIGTDRNHDRYWVFSGGLPGLYVEKGWVTENITYRVAPESTDPDENSGDSDSEAESVVEEGGGGKKVSEEEKKAKEQRKKDTIEKTVPHPGQNLWFVYETEDEIEDLLNRLHKQGVRESELKSAIHKHLQQIYTALGLAKCPTKGCNGSGNTNGFSKTHVSVNSCPIANPTQDEDEDDDEDKDTEAMDTDKDSGDKEETSSCDGDTELKEAFRRELLEMEMRLRNGGLGGVTDIEEWEARLMTSDSFQTAGQCLLETQQGIQDRFLDGIMMKKKPKPDDIKEEKMETDEPEVEAPRGVVDWREALDSVNTWSRLHVLLGVLDSCVKWEKSAENAKCKICRKKKDDYEELLLCDECNQPFHLYCLRPALFSVPKGDWFCPACIPTSQKRRCRAPTRYEEASDSGTDVEEEAQDKEENCCMCGGDEGLVSCSKCPSSYHLDCHDPPLRHTPRGKWECQPCKAGIPLRKRPKPRRPPPTRRAVSDSESDESEDEDEDDTDVEETDEELRTAINESVKGGRPRNRQSAAAAATVTSRSSGRSRKPSRKLADSSTDEDESPRRTSGRARTSAGPKPVDPSVFTEITNRLYRHRSSWPFRDPVDPEEVPDYYQIIKSPITLLDVQERCSDERYQRTDDYVSDVKLMFNNAEEYNKVDSEVYQCMCVLEKYFKETIESKIPHFTYEREFVLSSQSRGSKHAVG